VVLDCAHGAAHEAGPEVFSRLGAELVVLHDDPDGCNINDHCGSTYPESLQAAVLEHGADLGLAFDGDADRVLAVDAAGTLVDGDQILLACARDLLAQGLLRNNAVAITVMANLGLRRALAGSGIELVETPVGDRYVLEALEQHDLVLGGEQSGHIVFRDLATTGDGLLTGLRLCDVVRRSGRSLAEVAGFERYPQVLRNLRVAGRAPAVASELGPAVTAATGALAGEGRVVVRASGTEPVLRIMVEARTPELAEAMVDRLAEAAHEAVGRLQEPGEPADRKGVGRS
jgi:phosphoglucosamine mutase